MVCKFFLSFRVLPFHFVDCSFTRQKLLMGDNPTLPLWNLAQSFPPSALSLYLAHIHAVPGNSNMKVL